MMDKNIARAIIAPRAIEKLPERGVAYSDISL